MHPHTFVFALMTFLHDLFTVTWIGGLIAMGLVTLPAAKKVFGPGPQTKQFMHAVQKRQSVLVYVSMVGLALTGFLLSKRSPDFTGLFSFASTFSLLLSIKHILMLAMVATALYRSLSAKQGGAAREKLNFALLVLNIGLGVVILLLTGLLVAYAA
nr:hypothetical protein [Anaerolineae bacterium]